MTTAATGMARRSPSTVNNVAPEVTPPADTTARRRHRKGVRPGLRSLTRALSTEPGVARQLGRRGPPRPPCHAVARPRSVRSGTTYDDNGTYTVTVTVTDKDGDERRGARSRSRSPTSPRRRRSLTTARSSRAGPDVLLRRARPTPGGGHGGRLPRYVVPLRWFVVRQRAGLRRRGIDATVQALLRSPTTRQSQTVRAQDPGQGRRLDGVHDDRHGQ